MDVALIRAWFVLGVFRLSWQIRHILFFSEQLSRNFDGDSERKSENWSYTSRNKSTYAFPGTNQPCNFINFSIFDVRDWITCCCFLLAIFYLTLQKFSCAVNCSYSPLQVQIRQWLRPCFWTGPGGSLSDSAGEAIDLPPLLTSCCTRLFTIK